MRHFTAIASIFSARENSGCRQAKGAQHGSARCQHHHLPHRFPVLLVWANLGHLDIHSLDRSDGNRGIDRCHSRQPRVTTASGGAVQGAMAAHDIKEIRSLRGYAWVM